MAKSIKTIIKLQIVGGKANPAPPVGPALGQHGLNIQDFCTKFNEATRQTRMDEVVPVEITVFDDRTFTFIMKTPPAAELLKKAAGITKGSGKPNSVKAGKVTRAQIEEIAKIKLPDLNTQEIESAKKTIEGTARQMGLNIID